MEPMNYEMLSKMLQRFYWTFRIPVSLYLDSQPLVSYAAIAFEPDLAFLYLKNTFSSNTCREAGIFYTSSHDVHCGIVQIRKTQYHVLVGPASSFPPTAEQCSGVLSDLSLPLSKKRELLYGLSKTPTFDHGRFLSLLKFMDFMFNGSVGTVDNLNNAEPDIEPKNYGEEFYDVYHNTYELENTILRTIQDGRYDDLLKILVQVPSSDATLGITSKDSVRIFKNAFITSAALVSRAAVRGGMDYDYALTLSDFYIRDMEKMNNESSILPLLGLMMVDYCTHIARLNKPESCSPLTTSILDDVMRHLHDNLTVADIAKRLHRSSSYISRTFEQEMHIPLKQYIIQQKIEEAQRLLSSKKHSISDIAIQLNFSSQSHFQTVFKKITGMTPSAYRKQRL